MRARKIKKSTVSFLFSRALMCNGTDFKTEITRCICTNRGCGLPSLREIKRDGATLAARSDFVVPLTNDAIGHEIHGMFSVRYFITIGEVFHQWNRIAFRLEALGVD